MSTPVAIFLLPGVDQLLYGGQVTDAVIAMLIQIAHAYAG